MKIAFCKLTEQTGHEAGRQLLAELYRQETGADLPEIRVTDRGKPYFPDSPWHFSISHTRFRAFCVLSENNVGIDAEELDRKINLKLAEKILSPRQALIEEALASVEKISVIYGETEPFC